MTQIISLDQIKKIVATIDTQVLVKGIEDGFVAYSKHQAVVPSVGYLEFKDPPGDAHIKYGYIQNDDYFVIKVATSFYDNPKLGLSSSNGTMLVFSQKTGELNGILLDEGYLTNVRTALAGAVIARYLAPAHVEAIGIVGTGIQARLQLRYLRDVLDCRKVYVYGRSDEALQKYIEETQDWGFDIAETRNIEDITEHCNYIVTTTPSTQPLIMTHQLRAGTHITAMGADAPGKQELDPTIIEKADIVVVDSLQQCIDHGESC